MTPGARGEVKVAAVFAELMTVDRQLQSIAKHYIVLLVPVSVPIVWEFEEQRFEKRRLPSIGDGEHIRVIVRNQAVLDVDGIPHD